MKYWFLAHFLAELLENYVFSNSVNRKFPFSQKIPKTLFWLSLIDCCSHILTIKQNHIDKSQEFIKEKIDYKGMQTADENLSEFLWKINLWSEFSKKNTK